MGFGLRPGKGGGARNKANVSYDGRLRAVPADATERTIPDMGKGRNDNGVLYSGQMLDFNSAGSEYVAVGDISASCKSLEITIDPDSTTEGIIQLASGVSVKIDSGTLTTTGLSNVTTYVNGVAGSTVAAETTVLALTFDAVSCSDVNLGYDGTSYFDGMQGNVKLWTETLDSDDVAFSYANPETPAHNRTGTSLTEAGLVEYWPLIEGSGDTAYDWSGNGNHGILTNFTTPDDIGWANGAGLSDPHVCQTALMEWGMGSNLLATSSIDGWAATDISLTPNYDAGLENIGGTRVVATSVNGKWRNSITVNPGTDYVFWFFAKNNGGAEVKYGVYDNIASAWIVSATSYAAQLSNDDYTLIAIPFTTPAGCTNVILYPIVAAGTTDVDVVIWPHVFMTTGSTPTASTITHAYPATNALVPIRDWESAGQFTRDYNELNFNGRSYADCGDGADVNPSTALIVECVITRKQAELIENYFLKKGEVLKFRIGRSYNSTSATCLIQTNGGDTVWGSQYFSDSNKHHLVVAYSSVDGNFYYYMDGGDKLTDTSTDANKLIKQNVDNLIINKDASPSPAKQLPLLNMTIDDAAQKIIDGGLDTYVVKRYANAQRLYGVE